MSLVQVFTSLQRKDSTSALVGLLSMFPVGPAMHVSLASGALCAGMFVTTRKLTVHDLCAGRGAAYVHGALRGLLGPHREFQGPDGALGHEVSAPGVPQSGLVNCILLPPSDPAVASGGKREGACENMCLLFLQVLSWRHPLGCPINGLALATAPPINLGLTAPR